MRSRMCSACSLISSRDMLLPPEALGLPPRLWRSLWPSPDDRLCEDCSPEPCLLHAQLFGKGGTPSKVDQTYAEFHPRRPSMQSHVKVTKTTHAQHQ